MTDSDIKILEKYFPLETIEIVVSCFRKSFFRLHIGNPRKVQLGTFIPNIRNTKLPHKIVMNGDLGKYTFFLVFMHELAHLLVWNNYKNAVKPHGSEWKEIFSGMLHAIVEKQILPPELNSFLQNNLSAAVSASHRHPKLLTILHKLDGKGARYVVADIAENAVFKNLSGRQFLKLEKQRTRFKCQCVETGRLYLVSGQMEIIPETGQG